MKINNLTIEGESHLVNHNPLYIGIVLKKRRVEKCISQEELSFRSSTTRTYISMLERNLKKPSLETIFAIAAAFEIKASEFIKEVEDHHEENQTEMIG
ncbi:helix-turn-helix domain-containing protein [Neobacillus niacini]|uniref:helix-turn-helix domain-containing protein n=1 Tax=Neobacillus niacini TaxID=86668 RepID=UPI002FFE7DA4